MKKYINTIKIIAIALLTLLLGVDAKAQMSDLGVVWKRNNFTTNESSFYNVTAQPDGTYLVSGNIIINDVPNGYVVHFNEEGKTIKEYIIPMPQTTSTTVGDPSCSLRKAYFLQDGSIIAVGTIANLTANIADKHPHGSLPYALIYGAWFVKIDPETNTYPINRLDRGLIYNDLTYNGFDQSSLITYGADVWLQDPISNMQDIALIRVYDKDGNVLHDNQQLSDADRLKGNGLSRATLQSNGSILINSNVGIISFSSTTFKIIEEYNVPNLTCAPTTFPAGAYRWPRYEGVSPLADGKFLVSQPISYIATPRQYFGWIMAKYNASGVLEDCNIVESFDTEVLTSGTYDYIYPAPGSTTDYLGTYIDMHGRRFMYKYTDNGTFPNIQMGEAYPFNTSLSIPSSKDGFFSCGKDVSTKTAALAKLSTCANFKVITLPEDKLIIKSYAPTINVTLPVEYEGAKGSVDYFIKAIVKSGIVDGKTEGEELSVEDGVVGVQSSGLAFNLNKTYNLSTKYAMIEYTLVLKDSYTTAGQNQSCSQTNIFYVMTAPQTDVVAMPTFEKTSSSNKIRATIKNIGQGAFENYKITIYENEKGNAKKYTYTRNGLITIGETVRLDIDLTNTPVANSAKVVVCFNDEGTGNIGQIETDSRVLEYVVE